MPFGIGAAISGLGSVIGGGKSADAATDAAKVQAAAANRATDLQQNVLQTIHGEETPYRDIGTFPDIYNQFIGRTVALGDALPNALQGNPGDFFTQPTTTGFQGLTPTTTNATFAAPQPTTNGPASTATYTNPNTWQNVNPTTTASTAPTAWNANSWGFNSPDPAQRQAFLEQTPGYQFTLQQGLRGVQNSEAAKGRGVSGNALTAAGQYATGLANQTFNQQFQNSLQNQAQGFNQTLGSQAQQFGQGLGSAGLSLQNQQQAYGQGLGAANLALQGQQQSFGQQLASTAQQLQGQQQGFNQQLGAGTFGLQGQQQQFGQQLGANQANFNMLTGAQQQQFAQNLQRLGIPLQALQNAIGIGQSAVSGGSQAAQSILPGIANSITGAGAAQAGGIVGANNALVGGIGGATNQLSNYLLLNQLTGGGNSGGGGFSLSSLFGGGGSPYGASGTGGFY